MRVASSLAATTCCLMLLCLTLIYSLEIRALALQSSPSLSILFSSSSRPKRAFARSIKIYSSSLITDTAAGSPPHILSEQFSRSGLLSIGAFFAIQPPSVSSFLITGKVVADVLGSAAQRNRLDATTFKFVNLGLFLSSASLLIYFIVDSFLFLASSGLSKDYLHYVRTLLLLTYISQTLIATTRTLLMYKLPTVKLAPAAGLLPFSFLASTAAYFAYLVMTLYKLISSKTLLLTALSAVASCALIIPVLLALHGAAVAGPKRLSSDTYKQLNLGLIMGSAFGFVEHFLKTAGKHSSLCSILIYGLHSFTALAALSAWRTGIAYNPQQKIDVRM